MVVSAVRQEARQCDDSPDGERRVVSIRPAAGAWPSRWLNCADTVATPKMSMVSGQRQG